ncbi:TRAP transporter large permease [Maledivibacter halophilus]|uniref:C4-dicarboxylate transporter, DctM subunit n=1 Tax=Maledivibacter halophilus TaxID=36842 RepID=A0A1T5KQG5_9FIRM|nr:TRAP transporter large permease [Maledivibacter halophilus]SKC65893.1 C4-dicarboxylate transporter, DctM subunit [Maledivibacter halophilus]
MVMIVVIVTFFALLVSGVAVSFTLGLSSLLYLVLTDTNLIVITQRMFAGSDSFTLMAIPLFIFAGEIMNECGVTKRIINFSQSLLGFIAGGLANVNIFASMIMAGISGSTTADVASIGNMLIHSMEKSGYNRAYATAITAASGTIGSIIPPSILMILYGSITGISIGKLFLAGVIPGILTGVAQMIYAVYKAKKNPNLYDGNSVIFNWKDLRKNFLDAIPALIMPLIIIGGILSGVFTATEAGAIASLYGLIIGIFVYKEFKGNRILSTLLNSAKTTGMSMLIVAAAMTFSWILAKEGFPREVANMINGVSQEPSIVLLAMILVMMIIGCFMDTTAAAIIMVPIFAPIAQQIGLDPIHFAMIMVLTFILGGITPPVGITLYVASAVGNVKIKPLLKEMLPLILISLIILMMVAYIPQITMFLPNLLN